RRGGSRGRGRRMRVRGLEADRIQECAAVVEIFAAGGEAVRSQQVGQDVGVRLRAQAPGRILRHGGADAVKKRAEGEPVEIRNERAARQSRSFVNARQIVAMAGGAALGVGGRSARRLRQRVD